MSKTKKYIHGQAGGKALFEREGSEYFSKMAKKAHARRRRLARLEVKGLVVKKKKK